MHFTALFSDNVLNCNKSVTLVDDSLNNFFVTQFTVFFVQYNKRQRLCAEELLPRPIEEKIGEFPAASLTLCFNASGNLMLNGGL